MRVMITGGATSYVGQFLIDRLKSAAIDPSWLTLCCTSTKKVQSLPRVQHFVLDFLKEDTVKSCVKEFLPDIVINLAAMTSPAACQKNPDTVRGVNCPLVLIEALKEFCPNAKVIHMSTDHVYDGDNSPYEESDELKPVNLYGQSKRDFENALIEAFPDRCVILRSSVIYGPRAMQKAGKTTTFLHFVRENLKKDDSFIVFNDERRNFIPINNVVDVIFFFLCEFNPGIYNLGGPEALSRFEFAKIVAKNDGVSDEDIERKIESMRRSECKAAWAHSCPQPKNLEMDVSKLHNLMGPMMHFQTLQETLTQKVIVPTLTAATIDARK